MAEVTTPERELSYRYNFKGQRAEKVADGQRRYYLYDQNNLLVAEIAADGSVAKEYIYLEGEPLAMLVDGQLYYYHNSHLGTPLLLSDAQQQVVWQAEYSAFGKAEVQVATIENNLRFPGQYFDEETGLHYNYFRDYDPQTGRYLQSDPIGLAGGINTYGYVFSNPIRFVDSLGLSPEDVSAIINQFNSTVNNMTANRQRTSPGVWNNMQRSLHDVTGGTFGEKYKSCGEQSTQLQSDLDFQKYDDQWRFSTIPSPNAWCIGGHCTHWVTQALSNNSSDPVIILDPWSNKWSADYGK